MIEITTFLGNIVGVLGFATAIGSVVYQRKQTQLMEAGLARELDAPEGESGTGIESKLRAVINRRLSDNRAKMREEFRPRLDRIEALLQESYITEHSAIVSRLASLLTDENRIMQIADEAGRIQEQIARDKEMILAEAGRNSEEITRQGREIGTLEQQIKDMRNGVGYQDMARTYIRLIAEQLLQMTGQTQRTALENTALYRGEYRYDSAATDTEPFPE